MYYCKNCGGEFESPEKTYEKHGLSSPPFEPLYICPYCSSTEFREKTATHCRCCGAKLKKGDTEYCSISCRKKGEKLWERERLRLNLQQESPINKIIKELQGYNKLNGTNYSYGQYVSLMNCKRSNKKCAKKKSNI